MRRIIFFMLLLIYILCMPGCGQDEEFIDSLSSIVSENDDQAYEITTKRDVLCLFLAYPDYIVNLEKKPDGNIYIIMKSGKRIIYDDKKQKNSNEKLWNPDLQDMMEQVYPLGDSKELMPEDFDPGRFRTYALFNEVYGSTKEKVQKNLASVKGGFGTLLFNRENNAASALEEALKELARLVQWNKGISSFIYPINGTYNYRYIAGTKLLSVHSYGIAIDLATNKHDYWKWATRVNGQRRISEYPGAIVKIFEKNGFIWGGKWGHFDIMHYEYRPELILKARYFSRQPQIGELWHRDLHNAIPDAQKYIRIINKVLDG